MTEKKIRVVRLIKTCYAMPAQWEGLTDDGRPVYVRFRFGEGHVQIGTVEDAQRTTVEWINKATSTVVAIWEGRHGLDGDMDLSDLKKVTPEIEWPESDGAVDPDDGITFHDPTT